MNLEAVIERMEAAGMDPASILVAVKCISAEMSSRAVTGAERTAKWRAGKKVNRDSGDAGDVTPVTDVTNPPHPLEYNNINITPLKVVNNLPLNPPPSRANGTNPRALGTNPRHSAVDPDGFADFWEAYPKRDGSADRKGAVKAFTAAVRRADITTIIEGATLFSEAMTARGKVGTEFIPQARTWLNGDRWNERYDAAPTGTTQEAEWLATIQKYASSTGS